MIPFLIVPETRAPTRTAPRNSSTAAARIACFMVREREETAGANELATLMQGQPLDMIEICAQANLLVGTDVVGIEGAEDDTKGEEVVVLGEDSHGETSVLGSKLVFVDSSRCQRPFWR